MPRQRERSRSPSFTIPTPEIHRAGRYHDLLLPDTGDDYPGQGAVFALELASKAGKRAKKDWTPVTDLRFVAVTAVHEYRLTTTDEAQKFLDAEARHDAEEKRKEEEEE